MMKIREKFTLMLLLILGTIPTILVFGQTGSIKDGKKIILKSDGTWKYVDTTASNCNEWIETKTDKVTGNTSISAKKPLIISTDGGKTGFKIIMTNGGSLGNNFILAIYANGAGNCIDKGSKINLLFTDGTRMELYTDNDFNCENEATVYFGGIFGKKKELGELKTKKIETMRVWTSNSYVEEDFITENQNEIFNVINCLTPDALSLTLDKSTFDVITMKLESDGTFKWNTKNETGKLPFIIEQYRWNKWIKVGEMEGNGMGDNNDYILKINNLHSGENQIRIKQIDYSTRPRYSKPISCISNKSIVTFRPRAPTKIINFSNETMYEIYDQNGYKLKEGIGTQLDVSDLSKGVYYLNYDNTTSEFLKK